MLWDLNTDMPPAGINLNENIIFMSKQITLDTIYTVHVLYAKTMVMLCQGATPEFSNVNSLRGTFASQ